MQITDRTFYSRLDMPEYLQLPGLSYSGIKNNGQAIETTAAMGLGTLVHQYLGEPAKYDHSNPLIKKLAVEAKKAIGVLWKYAETEVAVTANFHHEGLTMPYKGRSDFMIPKKMIIDYKIIKGKSVKDTIGFFGYTEQLSGYAKGLDCPLAFIIAINSKTLNTEIINMPIQTEWWDKQILKYGR